MAKRNYNSSITKLLKEKARAQSKADIGAEADICNALGEEFAQAGYVEEAFDEHKRELHLSEAGADQLGIATAYRKLGERCTEMERFKDAFRYLNKYLDIAERQGFRQEVQRANVTMGNTLLVQVTSGHSQGRLAGECLEKAEAAYTRSLALCEELKSSLFSLEYMRMKAGALMNLGLVQDAKNDVAACASFFKRAIAITEHSEKLGDLQQLCCNNLADLYRRNNGLQQALTYYRKSLTLAEKLGGDKVVEVHCLRAVVFLEKEDFRMCRKSFHRAYRVKHSNPEAQAEILRNLKTAVRLEQGASRIVGELSNMARLRHCEKMGDLAASVGAYQLAIRQYSQMLRHAEAIAMRGEELAPVLVSLAATYYDVRDYPHAIEYYQREITCRTDHAQIARSYLIIAECQVKLDGNFERAIVTYKTASTHADSSGRNSVQRQVLEELARAQEDTGDSAGQRETQSRLEALPPSTEEGESEAMTASEDSVPGESSDVDIEELSCSDPEPEELQTRVRSRANARWYERRNEKGETPLHTACISGDIKRVMAALDKGHPVNIRDYAGWMPLHEACNHAFPAIVQLLIDKGAHVNDAGGKDCGKTTPLHDVCAQTCAKEDFKDSSTHVQRCVDIIRILLRHGANPSAKDDNGQTALHYLREQRQANADQLTRHEKSAVRQTEEIILKVQQGSNPRDQLELCESLARREEQHQSSDEGDSMPELTVPRKRKRAIRRVIDSEDPESQALDSPCASDGELGDSEERMPTHTDVLETLEEHPERAPLAYKECMQSMRRSAADATALPKAAPKARPSGPALVTDDVYVGDDWLEDDLRPNRRKRRNPDAEYFATGARKRTALSQANAEPTSTQSSSIASPVASPPTSPTSPITSTTPLYPIFSQPSSIEVHQQQERAPAVNVLSTVPPPVRSSGITRLRVRVAGDTVVIPVRDDAVTFSWLAEEAGKRYEARHSAKPVLSLTTSDGAIYAQADAVTDMLVNNDLVDSIVESWELTPLPQRYTAACKVLQATAYRNIQHVLRESDDSHVLTLQGLALRARQFHPIARALENQCNLKVLCLSGNRLGDEGLNHLAKCLPSLSGLAELDLACNEITAPGIEHVVTSLEARANDKPLKYLEKLDLGFNPLGDSSTQPMCRLISLLPALCKLVLRSCKLTSGFFQHHRLTFANSLRGSCVHELDFSLNKLGCLGVELLLMCLKVDGVTSLDLGGTVSSSDRGVLAKHLSKFLMQPGCEMQELVVDGCSLGPEHIPDLCRALLRNSSLERLSLNGNPLKADQVEDLLQAARDSPVSRLQSIAFNGKVFEI